MRESVKMTQTRVKSVLSPAEVKNSAVSSFLSKQANTQTPTTGLYSSSILQPEIETAFSDFKGSDKFKTLHLENFPITAREIKDLSDFISSKMAEIYKAVYLANQLTDQKQKLELLDECCKYFKILHDYLISQKILPPVFPMSDDKKTQDTQVLFWSSGLGENAAKAFSKYVSAGSDLTLMSLGVGEDEKSIDDLILETAKDNRRPILIKKSDNTYMIYGYRENMKWGFTKLDTTHLDLGRLPFPPPLGTKKIPSSEFDKLNKDLIKALKQGHTSFGAVTDTVAGTQYINDLYGYTLFKDLYEDKNYELLKEFYWRAMSYIYASEVAVSSVPAVVYMMDTLTENNFFTNMELPILRTINAVINLKRIANKVESSNIVIPGEDKLSKEINECSKDKKGWSVKYEKTKDKNTGAVKVLTTMNLNLFSDKENKNKVGSLTIKGYKTGTIKSDGTKEQKRDYSLLVTLGTPPETTRIPIGNPKEILKLWNIQWQAEIQKEMPLDRFFKTRTLVKSTAKDKKRSSISVPSFERGFSKELSSPVNAAKKSQRLGIAYELPVKHTWLYAYIEHKANPGNQSSPVFGPKYYINALEKITHQAEKEKAAIEFMKEIKQQVKVIEQIIESNFPASLSDPIANRDVIMQRKQCYEAFHQIIKDSLETIDHLKKLTAIPKVDEEKSPTKSEKADIKKPSISLFRKHQWVLMGYEAKAVRQLEALKAIKLPPAPAPKPR